VANVSITLVSEITEMVQPSLSCFVRMPFGLTMGAVGDVATHDAVATAVLREAEQAHPAGTVVALPFAWEQDDLRARQLRKQAL
jgi:hypothetical protein